MQNLVTTCDKCGKVFEGAPAVELTIWTTDRLHADLCSECLMKLWEWIGKDNGAEF